MDRSPPRQEHPHRRRWRGRVGATVLSAAAHTALAVALLVGWRTAAPPDFAPAIVVGLAPPLAPPPKPAAPRAAARKPAAHAAAKPAPARKLAAAHAVHRRRDHPPPRLARAPRAPPLADSPPVATVEASETDDGSGLTDAQLAGAQAAGEGGDGGSGGGGGGACDMARRVQAALRKDPLARAAVHGAGGRAIMIWNGDWVRSSVEDGKGLAAVREAITFEVAFAPPACRHQRVRGLVTLSLADGSARLALGAGDWRWSDLLGLR